MISENTVMQTKDSPVSMVQSAEIMDDTQLFLIRNNDDVSHSLSDTTQQDIVHIFFCNRGQSEFIFHNGAYRYPLQEGKSFLYYNPQMELPVQIEVSAQNNLAGINIPVKELHKLFVNNEEELSFLTGDRAKQKFYVEQDLSPALRIALDQLFNARPAQNSPAASLFYKGKAMEILSYYFTREQERKDSSCPFLDDEKNVERIRKAKRILLDNMTDPPQIKDLALQVGINEYRLKVGFKNIYGKPLYQYLTDFRLDVARKMLHEGNCKVNEVAYNIGYTNPSHFISAFKKRFGLTPKKFLTSINQ